MGSIKIKYANGSHVGKVRSENQDYFGAYEVDDAYLFILCDGMGGHEGGQEASRLGVEAIKEYIINNYNKIKTIEKLLEEAILYANAKIYEEALNKNYSRGMGTTVVVAFIKDGKMYYAHVGDSRIYLLRNGKLKSLTEDHTLVHQLVKMGKITEEEAEIHPGRHQLLQALGIDKNVFVDIPKEPLKLKKGDYILLCSDGLHGYVKEDYIKEIILTPELNLMQKVEKLIQAALDVGGYDNVTIQLIEVIESEEEAPKNMTKLHKRNIVLGVSAISILIIALTVYLLIFNKEQNDITEKKPETKKHTKITKDTLETNKFVEKKDSMQSSEDTTIKNKGLDTLQVEKKETHEVSNKRESAQEVLTTSYIVKKGETLSHIATKFCVSLKELESINNITSDKIKEGQKINVPIRVNHKVKKGEVLSIIAEKYKVPLSKLKEINNIKDENIREGQNLIIPNCNN